MENKTKRYWFPAKRYGWGWGFPCAWQGWVVFLVFILVVLILPFVIDPNDQMPLYLGTMMGAAALLLGVCYAKGEPPKWRWGNSGEDQENAEQDVDPED